MDLKKALGSHFKEGMTLEEAMAALADYDPTQGMVSKSALDKAASEAASYKKQLRDHLSEEEKAAADRQQAEADKNARIEELTRQVESLQKESAVAGYKANFIALGYEEKLAEATAKACADGDMSALFANQKTFLEARDKAYEARLLEKTPRPGAGSAGKTVTKEQFESMSYSQLAALKAESPALYESLSKE